MKKILVIKFGAIGDVVHSTIIQQAIKNTHPDCEVHFLTSSVIAPLLENDPNLGKVYSLDMAKKNDFFQLLKLGFILRKEKFDTIINLQNSFRNIFLSKISGASKIIKRSNNRTHAVDSFFNSALEAFSDIDKPKNLRLFLSKNTLDFIKEKTKNYPRPFFVINPGGENDSLRQGRIWSLKNWIQLSNSLIQKYGGTIFIAGSKNEKSSHESLSVINSSVLFSGELKLEESTALFNIADLVISGDSGPLHIASALDVNTLGIMGSTSNSGCEPYGEKGFFINHSYKCDAVCGKICPKTQETPYKPCIESTTPEFVLEFIENQIFNKN